jgi:CRISPR-associated protein Cmr2
MSYLYLFQIGPVQSFIAQARRTQDLLVGSKMLSWLAGKGIQAAQRSSGFQPILPDQVRPDAPHKFAFLSDDAPPELPNRVHQAIESAWLSDFAEPIRAYLLEALGTGEWLSVYDRQKAGWLECYWVAVEHKGDYASDYGKLNRALNQRKQLRHFPQVEEPGWKCTLSGAQSSLPLNWEALRKRFYDRAGILIRNNERLGTLALVKRLAPHIPQVPPQFRQRVAEFPSTLAIAANDRKLKDEDVVESGGKEVSKYLAVLHMDGDRMGAALSQLKTLDQHKKFSQALGEFSARVADIVKKHGGEAGSLVYAGGDDVLALLPLSHVLPCADVIRTSFQEAMKHFGSEYGSPTMSAGIAITPHNLPLDTGLDLARRAEELAKDGYGRNAVVFTEAHGTGQLRSAGAKWDQVMEMMKHAQELFEQRRLSAKIAYDLQTIAHDMGGDKPKDAPYLAEARAAELRRLIKRRTAEGKPDIPDAFAQAITAYAEDHTWSDAANWLILARFLATGGQPEYSRAVKEA